MSDKLKEALEAAEKALDTWVNTYASDMCDEESVALAMNRVKEGGGTLAYIAGVQKLIRAALAEGSAPSLTDEQILEIYSSLSRARKSDLEFAVEFGRALLSRPIAAGWQPIETAPRDGTVFLAINARGNMDELQHFLCVSDDPPQGKVFAREAGFRQVGHVWPAYPTHWMRLPPPPAGKGQQS